MNILSEQMEKLTRKDQTQPRGNRRGQLSWHVIVFLIGLMFQRKCKVCFKIRKKQTIVQNNLITEQSNSKQ